MSVKESYAGKINRKLNKKLHVIDVAAGRAPADLVLKNATYVNVFSNELCHGDIAVAEGLIVGMGQYSGTTARWRWTYPASWCCPASSTLTSIWRALW